MLLVETANRLALAGLGALLLSLTGMVVLIVDVVFGAQWAAVAGATALLLFTAVWVAAPPWGSRATGGSPRTPRRTHRSRAVVSYAAAPTTEEPPRVAVRAAAGTPVTPTCRACRCEPAP